MTLLLVPRDSNPVDAPHMESTVTASPESGSPPTDTAPAEPSRSATTRRATAANDPSAALETLIYERLSAYVDSLQGHAPVDLYRLIMPQLERPLIRLALELAGGERQRAAKMLGIHRNTLRSRIRALGLEASE